jgi:hypothetical protein
MEETASGGGGSGKGRVAHHRSTDSTLEISDGVWREAWSSRQTASENLPVADAIEKEHACREYSAHQLDARK